MKHRVVGCRLDRTTEHRTAMFRNMVTSLIRHERITTTTPKAKELKRFADKIITLAKRATPHARRIANRDVRDVDNAELAIIELLDRKPAAPAEGEEKGEAKAAKAPKAPKAEKKPKAEKAEKPEKKAKKAKE